MGAAGGGDQRESLRGDVAAREGLVGVNTCQNSPRGPPNLPVCELNRFSELRTQRRLLDRGVGGVLPLAFRVDVSHSRCPVLRLLDASRRHPPLAPEALTCTRRPVCHGFLLWPCRTTPGDCRSVRTLTSAGLSQPRTSLSEGCRPATRLPARPASPADPCQRPLHFGRPRYMPLQLLTGGMSPTSGL